MLVDADEEVFVLPPVRDQHPNAEIVDLLREEKSSQDDVSEKFAAAIEEIEKEMEELTFDPPAETPDRQGAIKFIKKYNSHYEAHRDKYKEAVSLGDEIDKILAQQPNLEKCPEDAYDNELIQQLAALNVIRTLYKRTDSTSDSKAVSLREVMVSVKCQLCSSSRFALTIYL